MKDSRCSGVVCCQHGRCCSETSLSTRSQARQQQRKPISARRIPTPQGSSSTRSSDSEHSSSESAVNFPSEHPPPSDYDATREGDNDTEYQSINEQLSLINISHKDIAAMKSYKAEAAKSLCNVLNHIDNNKHAYDLRINESTGPYLPTIEPKETRVVHRQNMYSRYFIGCKTPLEAEATTERRTSFRLYYMLQKNTFELAEELEDGKDRNLLPTLHLYIVYRRADGRYNHYKIEKHLDNAGGVLYMVQYGDPKAPKFRSIERLLSCYNNYISVRSVRHGIETADIFPYWKNKEKLDFEL